MEQHSFDDSASQGPSSPQWLKPNDRLRLRKRIRKETQSTALQPLNQNIIGNRISLPKISAKIPVNPFKCSLNKRLKECDENNVPRSNVENDNLFSRGMPVAAKPFVVDALNEDANFVTSLQKKPLNDSEPVKDDSSKWHSSLPVDWSIKTKVRFISKTPFSWRGNFKASEEASGITGFSRCLYTDSGKNQCSLDTSAASRLYQHSLVWIHPFLPWLTLFPRVNAPNEQEKSRQPSVFANNAGLQESLHDQWCTSFRSLHQLVKARQCAFFYLCASTFTVLFRAAGVGGVPALQAIICPTSKSLRQSLAEEGIEFSMPLLRQQNGDFASQNDLCQETLASQDLSQSQEISKTFGDSTKNLLVDEEDEEDTVNWLESLGVSQEDLSSIKPKKRKNYNSQKDKMAAKQQSLVYVEGIHTQALVNFLINSEICSTTSGPLVGIPPTLLSPVAFQGAILKQLKMRQVTHKQDNQVFHLLEISGPVLPSALNSLCSLFSETQSGNFSAVTSSDKTTEPLTELRCSPGAPSAFAVESLKDCGLSQSFLRQVCSSRDCESKQQALLTKIKVENGLYSWKG